MLLKSTSLVKLIISIENLGKHKENKTQTWIWNKNLLREVEKNDNVNYQPNGRSRGPELLPSLV